MKCPQELIDLFPQNRAELEFLATKDERIRDIVADYACLLKDLPHQKRVQNQNAITDISAALLELQQDLRDALAAHRNTI